MDEQNPPEGVDELAIAIVGMAGRFPGAPDVEAFWRNLREGVEGIRSFTDDELRARGVPEAALRSSDFVKAGAVLEGVDLFDAGFFGYSPREAALMDPQHRAFLECAWEALERSGFEPDGPRSVGVFAGTSLSTYLLFNLLTHRELIEAGDTFQVMIGNDKDFLATRLAYHLDLRGPSLDVQTGCSTSLVATHLACQALLGFQCDVAVAGGVSVDVPQRTGYMHQPGGIASPDGHCRPFDANGQGTVFGSGVGVVVLKRLEDALRDGNPIHAIIRGSAINNDGASKLGFTAPSVEGQVEVIARAQAMAGVTPDQIEYVETHGTGTLLGDPIEVSALTQVFRESTDANRFCALGSVKSNIGHLDAAAGVAGLIKATLAVEHGLIPPTLHFEKPNPNIDWEQSPFFVNAKAQEWRPKSGPRRAGVSSFGIGGTNAHAILEQPPALPATGAGRPWKLLVLSAKTETALEAATQRLAAHLEHHPELELADVAYTLQRGRKTFPHRRFLVCEDTQDAAEALASGDPERLVTESGRLEDRPVVFMFPGGGAQYLRMGEELYAQEPVFREHFDKCAALLRRSAGLALHDIVYPAKTAEEAEAKLTRTSTALPALFVVEYCLARLWMSWGIEPRAMIGHSVGEYVAACLAGVFSLEDALALVCERGRLFERLPRGEMVSVSLSEQDMRPLLGDHLSLAALNGPEQCVVAGDSAAVERLVAELGTRGIEFRRLHIDVAAHSHLVEPILPAFGAFVAKLKLSAPTRPFVSGVSGTWITPAEATSPDYWVRHLRQTVRFGQGIQTLLAEPKHVLLEVGPGRTLSSLARLQIDRASTVITAASMRSPRENQPDGAFLLTTLGRLWQAGVRVPWARVHEGERRRYVVLPTYPFERRRHWMDPRPVHTSAPAASLQKRPEVSDWFYLPSWKRALPPAPPAKAEPQRWLLFVDSHGLGHLLARRLQDAGHTVITVSAGESFCRAGEGAYELQPHRREDYSTLLASLSEEERLPERIVHLWSVGEPEPGEAGRARVQQLGFDSLLLLAQALGALPPAARHLDVLSTGVQAVTGHESLCPDKATVLGPCRVLPREMLRLTCRSIDVELEGSTERTDALVTRLLAELSVPAAGATVALRGHHRWEQSFEPVRLPPAAPRLRQRGTYLITGGLGGIGLVLAEHLARTVQARLVLVGRSSFPARTEWDGWLATHGEADATSRRIQQLRTLESLGAEVLVLRADVGDASRMEAVLQQARDTFGELHGVIHAAGVPAGGLSQFKTAEAVASVFQPKIRGTWVLHTLLRGTPLDFFLLCSSRTAIVGDFGQVEHCAANAFLDAFAQQRAAEGDGPVFAVGWDTWKEVGQAVTTAMPDSLKHLRDALLEHALSSAEGLQVFDRVLSAGLPQVLVSTQDFSAVLANGPALFQDVTASLGDALSSAVADGDVDAAAGAPAGGDLGQKLASIWQRLLGVERVNPHDNFFDLGGNSLIGLKVIAEVKRTLGVDLPTVSLFENPTLGALTRLLGGGPEPEAATTFTERRTRGAQRRDRLLRKLDTK
ncbi:beta-ketoacyl synthase N-terminal-like domain-containing protein [Archangium lansingense]|uniref:type I polyketide synthase n=1 Tax=Archangium lansingense TaxID=2995310 RepID=UPI003B7C986E